MTKKSGTKLIARVGSRRPYQRLTEVHKRKIAREVSSGLIGIRAACRKYGLNRNTLKSWLILFSLPVVEDLPPAEQSPDMPDNPSNQTLSRQVKALTKALAQAQLKASGLQTMIEVAEDELKIKIRKKSGRSGAPSKRSNE